MKIFIYILNERARPMLFCAVFYVRWNGFLRAGGWTGSWAVGRGHQMTRGTVVVRGKGRCRGKNVVGSIVAPKHSVAYSFIPSSMFTCLQTLSISQDHHIITKRNQLKSSLWHDSLFIRIVKTILLNENIFSSKMFYLLRNIFNNFSSFSLFLTCNRRQT